MYCTQMQYNDWYQHLYLNMWYNYIYITIIQLLDMVFTKKNPQKNEEKKMKKKKWKKS